MKLELIIEADGEPRASDLEPLLNFLTLIPLGELDNVKIKDIDGKVYPFENFNPQVLGIYITEGKITLCYQSDYKFVLE